MDVENRDLNEKLNHYFSGRVVRKDLTQKSKKVPMSPYMS